jgi:pimeloyl-ACP methyl ester carboxylesterase
MWGPEPVRLCTVDGLFLAAAYYASVSDGPCYLLGHGFTNSLEHPGFRATAAHLHGLGASVLALSFRGHGRSQGRSTVGVDEVRDIAAGLSWLAGRRPGAPVITMGFSMGASVVIRHAGLVCGSGSAGISADDCRPAAVVAVSGPGRWYERGTKPMRKVNLGLETALGRQVLRWALRTRIGRGWDLLPAAPVEVAPAITMPALIVHGSDDSYFGLAHPRMLASAIPGAELWIEPGMGHAESATAAELLDRIDGWARRALAASATMDR